MVTHAASVEHENVHNAKTQTLQHTINVKEQTLSTIVNNEGHKNHNNDRAQKPVCAVSPIKQTSEHVERPNNVDTSDLYAMPLLSNNTKTHSSQNLTIMKEMSATESGRNYTCITNSNTKGTEGPSNLASFV